MLYYIIKILCIPEKYYVTYFFTFRPLNKKLKGFSLWTIYNVMTNIDNFLGVTELNFIHRKFNNQFLLETLIKHKYNIVQIYTVLGCASA